MACAFGQLGAGGLQLEPSALAFLVTSGIAATGWGRVVRLALQVLGDPVVLDN